ncbi:hypothetical protein HPB51_015574 [Rhipicephalus microplus]|uniref:Uncharacterized protein n=1 Tax=Rhipicephalus microplus TaxID=6941 RepID=A0A9J6DHB3_RHIMP|nr:hypothetical protein HPB51_015574 [Rhipicephalus microplus]
MRVCGVASPSKDHECTPRCHLCGKEHVTGDIRSKELFRTPHRVKKRPCEMKLEEARGQEERRKAEADTPRHSRTDGVQDRPTRQSKHCSESRTRSESLPQLPPLEKQRVSHKARHDSGDCAPEKSKFTGPQWRAGLYERFSTSSMSTEATSPKFPHDDNLREQIRFVIREEMRMMFPTSRPEVSSLPTVIKKEVQHVLGMHGPCQAIKEPEVMTYAATAHHGPRTPALCQDAMMPQHCPPSTCAHSRPPLPARGAPRKTDI